MSSSWTEATAVLKKEAVSEFRGKHGLFTTLLFGVVTVAALSIGTAKISLSPTVSAALLIVALLFAAITGLARTFVLEEESGTGDLLRLLARPEPVFIGKLVYNLLLLWTLALLLATAYVFFSGIPVMDIALFAAGLAAASAALAAAVSFCGAIVAGARSHAALAGVISVPILLPVVLIAVGALRIAFGEPGESGWTSVLGLLGLAVGFSAVGPHLYAATWKR